MYGIYIKRKRATTVDFFFRFFLLLLLSAYPQLSRNLRQPVGTALSLSVTDHSRGCVQYIAVCLLYVSEKSLFFSVLKFINYRAPVMVVVLYIRFHSLVRLHVSENIRISCESSLGGTTVILQFETVKNMEICFRSHVIQLQYSCVYFLIIHNKLYLFPYTIIFK